MRSTAARSVSASPGEQARDYLCAGALKLRTGFAVSSLMRTCAPEVGLQRLAALQRSAEKIGSSTRRAARIRALSRRVLSTNQRIDFGGITRVLHRLQRRVGARPPAWGPPSTSRTALPAPTIPHRGPSQARLGLRPRARGDCTDARRPDADPGRGAGATDRDRTAHPAATIRPLRRGEPEVGPCPLPDARRAHRPR